MFEKMLSKEEIEKRIIEIDEVLENETKQLIELFEIKKQVLPFAIIGLILVCGSVVSSGIIIILKTIGIEIIQKISISNFIFAAGFILIYFIFNSWKIKLEYKIDVSNLKIWKYRSYKQLYSEKVDLYNKEK